MRNWLLLSLCALVLATALCPAPVAAAPYHKTCLDQLQIARRHLQFKQWRDAYAWTDRARVRLAGSPLAGDRLLARDLDAALGAIRYQDFWTADRVLDRVIGRLYALVGGGGFDPDYYNRQRWIRSINYLVDVLGHGNLFQARRDIRNLARDVQVQGQLTNENREYVRRLQYLIRKLDETYPPVQEVIYKLRILARDMNH